MLRSVTPTGHSFLFSVIWRLFLLVIGDELVVFLVQVCMRRLYLFLLKKKSHPVRHSQCAIKRPLDSL